MEGLEPPCLAAPDPKSGASANSATPAESNTGWPLRQPETGALLAKAFRHCERKSRFGKTAVGRTLPLGIQARSRLAFAVLLTPIEANSRGSSSAMSSEISPGPNRRAASVCKWTAEAAARWGSNPRPSKPAIIPARTSPDPAVASQGTDLRPVAALSQGIFPGVAMTVSAPLRTTVHPARSAASRAASIRENAGQVSGVVTNLSEMSGNSLENSPRCGVKTTFG